MDDDKSREAPPVAGALPHERTDWLPADTGLPWLEELREAHVEAVGAWCGLVAAVVEAGATSEAAARAWRRETRDAVSTGREPPPPLDDAVAGIRLEVVQEDAHLAREELAEVAVAALAELRKPERRLELEPHFGSCSQGLRSALLAGPGGRAEQARAMLRQQLERFADEPALVDLTDPTHAEFARDDGGELITSAH